MTNTLRAFCLYCNKTTKWVKYSATDHDVNSRLFECYCCGELTDEDEQVYDNCEGC